MTSYATEHERQVAARAEGHCDGVRFAADVAEHAAGSVTLEGRELAIWNAACETIARGLRAVAVPPGNDPAPNIAAEAMRLAHELGSIRTLYVAQARMISAAVARENALREELATVKSHGDTNTDRRADLVEIKRLTAEVERATIARDHWRARWRVEYDHAQGVAAYGQQRLTEIEERAKHVATGAPYRVVRDTARQRPTQYWVVAHDGDVLATVEGLVGTGDGIDALTAADFFAHAPADILALIASARGARVQSPRDVGRYVATVTIRATTVGAMVEALKTAWLDVLGATFPFQQAGGTGDTDTTIVVEAPTP